MNERMNEQATGTKRYDVVVVGGGAAGLSAALTLGRARRAVLVVDDGRPRNAPADGVHNYLGREGTPPDLLLADGRREVAGYGGEIRDGTVTAVSREGDGFRVVLADGGDVLARRLLVTTGLIDRLPDVPGMAERWGREVLHCPYCHGWEVRDRPIGVLATGPAGVHQALLWRQWSADVTLFVHAGPPPDDAARERLDARGIAVVEEKVTGLEVAGDRLTGVRLADGRHVPVAAVVAPPQTAARAGFLADLGLETAELSMAGTVVGVHVPSEPTGATSVPGVWVAGNVTSPSDTVIAAAAAGVRTAGVLNMDLVNEDTDRAVAARRAPFSTASEAETAASAAGDRRHGI